jgi:hypothetical protein
MLSLISWAFSAMNLRLGFATSEGSSKVGSKAVRQSKLMNVLASSAGDLGFESIDLKST